jgi:hypothetical protein
MTVTTRAMVLIGTLGITGTTDIIDTTTPLPECFSRDSRNRLVYALVLRG